MTKLTEAALDRAVAHAMGVKSVHDCEKWVGLTDEEVKNFVQAVWPREATPADYIRAIEAKLKEKNT